MSIRIIACGVFRDALRQIEPQRFHQNVTITFINPYLHNYPQLHSGELLLSIRLNHFRYTWFPIHHLFLEN